MFELLTIVGISFLGVAIFDLFNEEVGKEDPGSDNPRDGSGISNTNHSIVSTKLDPLHIDIDQIEWSDEANTLKSEDIYTQIDEEYIHIVDDPHQSETSNLTGTANVIVNSSNGDHVIEGDENGVEDRIFISVSRGGALIEGGDSDGEFYSSGANDTIFGADGDDFMVSGDDPAAMYGGDGNDTLFASYENIFVSVGNSGDDELVDEVFDSLDGGAGDDKIYGSGEDIISTGSGEDTVYLFGMNNIVEDFDPEQDTLQIHLSDDVDDAIDVEDFLVSMVGDDLILKVNDMNIVTLRNAGQVSIAVDSGFQDGFFDLIDGTEVFNPRIVLKI